MAELVDAADLKSVEGNTSWEFKSPYPHLKNFQSRYTFCGLNHNFAVWCALCLKIQYDKQTKNDYLDIALKHF